MAPTPPRVRRSAAEPRPASTVASSRSFAAGSPARTSASPTSTACAPAATTRLTSSPVKNPLSLTTAGPGGIEGRSASVVSRVVSNVQRSRLLMPITRASTASARSSSAAVCTSTSAPRPSPLAAAIRSASSASSRIETIKRIASAPAARASHTWYSSIVKSFRSSGRSTAPRTSRRMSRLPLKYFSSVSTEIAAAPLAAYTRPSATGSKSVASTPRDGDAFFSSAMTRTPPGGGRSAASKSCGDGTVRQSASSSSRDRDRRRSLSSSRLSRTIASRIDVGGCSIGFGARRGAP